MNNMIRKLLRRIYKDRYDEVAGDFQELYEIRSRERGKAFAKWMLLIDLWRALKNIAIPSREVRYSHNQVPTIFKLLFRRFLKNPLWSVFNLGGLTVAIAVFLFLQGYIQYEKSFDSHFENAKNIYRIDYQLTLKGKELSNSAACPPTIAPFAKATIPEIKDYARAHHFPGLVFRHESEIYRKDNVLMVDPSFLEFFDVKLIAGDVSKALNDKGSILLSQSTRGKFFGDENPVGKVMPIDGYSDYTVTGVFEDFSEHSHLSFDILLSFETARWWYEGETEEDWTSGGYHSYLLLPDNVDPKLIEKKFVEAYQSSAQGQVDQEKEIGRNYSLTPIKDIHLLEPLDRELNVGGNAQTLMSLSLIAYIILILALLNYANLLSIRGYSRSREVGLRKVIGAHRSQLIFHFLFEAIIIQLLAFGLGFMLTISTTPYLGDHFGFYWNVDHVLNVDSLALMASFPLIAFIVSGLLPAISMSAIPALSLLTGKLSKGKVGVYTRNALVFCQFTATIAIVLATVIVYAQITHLRNKDLGIDLSKTIAVRGPVVGDAPSNAFRTELLKYPQIQSVGATDNIPGIQDLEFAPLTRLDIEPAYKRLSGYRIGYGYLESLGTKLIAGRTHEEDRATDTTGILLNRLALELFEFESAESAIGTKMRFGSGYDAKIIGVIENFDQGAAKNKNQPLVFWHFPDYFSYYLIRYNSSNESETVATIQRIFNELYPDDPLDYFDVSEFYQRQYQADIKFSQSFIVFSLIATLIAIFGLLSLINWSTVVRKKEIAIRKVLGARLSEMIQLLSKESVVIAVASFVVACPIAYVFVQQWLDNYAYRISLTIDYFLIPGVALLILITLCLVLNLLPRIQENPVSGLRED